MTALIYHMPRTAPGRLEMVCARRTGRPLHGVDWDAVGQAEYAAFIRRWQAEQAEREDVVVAISRPEKTGGDAA